MEYGLRPFRRGDAPALVALRLLTIRQVGALGYSPVQIEAWADRVGNTREFLERFDKGDLIFVACDSADTPVAYALLETDGHLDHLYCHPGHTRRGLADLLLAMSEQKARELGATRLFTEASELAQPAFLRAGYSVLHRRDFEIGGVAIHNYAMEKLLT